MEWREEYRNALLDKTANPPDVRKIVKPHIPSYLYKYGSFQSQYWNDTIFKAKIYLSPAIAFNDPFDCRANFNYKKAVRKGKFREELLKLYSANDIDNLPEEIVQKCIIDLMREDVFVFCLSEVWDSILMWAHYANNYNGYCLEYDMKMVREHLIYNLYPVLYEEKYIDITDNLINYNGNAGLICNMAKAKEWSYEREWRIVEYRENPFYFRKALKAIYLGKNCSPKVKDDVIRWAKDNSKEVYIVEASKTQYKLEAHREV